MKKYLSIALYSVLILSSTFTYAQTTTPTTTNREYTVLAPLPGTTKNCTGDSCTADLNSYLSGFLGLAIGVGAMIAMLILAYYGFQYALSDSPSLKMKYKDEMWNILGGFFLIVSAYAIVRTINPKILPEKGFEIDINTPFMQGELTVATGTSATGGGIRPSRPGINMTTGEILASNLIRTQLENGKVYTYAGPCDQGQTRGCVNLNGLLTTTQVDLVELRKFCQTNCITITGGTEPVHSTTGSHPQGRGIDLRPNTELNEILSAENPKEGMKRRITLPSGRTIMFTYESAGGNAAGTSTGNHWHLDFN